MYGQTKRLSYENELQNLSEGVMLTLKSGIGLMFMAFKLPLNYLNELEKRELKDPLRVDLMDVSMNLSGLMEKELPPEEQFTRR